MNTIKYVALFCMLSQLPSAVEINAASETSVASQAEVEFAYGYNKRRHMRALNNCC